MASGKIEIRKVRLGRGGSGSKVEKPCIMSAKTGQWYTVKGIVVVAEAMTDDETAEEFELELADVLAAKSYAIQYPQIMD